MDTKLLGLILQGDKKNKQEFNRIKETYEEMSNSKANTITSSANGESIVLSDSADSILASLRVMGKSSQVTTSGKNLLPNNAVTTTVNGVTFTVNDDGSITVNGTASKQCSCRIYEGAFGDNCILSGCPSGSQYGALYRLQTVNYRNDGANDVWTVLARDEGTGAIIDTTQFNTGYVEIVITNGTTVSNLTFYPMIRLASITDPSYEPYTGGIPSPNPQYPQEIVSAGNDGDIEANVYGANLFDVAMLTDNKATHECFEEGRKITVVGSGAYAKTVFTLYPAGLYGKKLYLKGTFSGGNSPAFTGKIITSDGSHYISENTMRLGYTIDNTVESLELHLIGNNTTTVLDTPLTTVFEDVMLMLDPNATWTPYKAPQPLTIQTPNGLPGIKVTDPSIATYTDEAGQMWCADEVDFERGVYVKRIGKVDITRDRYKRHDFYETYNKFSFGTDILYDTDNYTSRTLPTLSNKFVANPRNIIGCFDSLTISNGGWQGYVRSIFVVDKSVASLDDFMNYVGDDCFVMIPLKEPIETPLSESELAAYKVLHTNYPNTTILNDSGAHMEVEYTADKKNYIDNKFAQITNAVLSMGSNV